MKKQISLYTAIQGEYELTEQDRQEILYLLTHRCRANTVRQMSLSIQYITTQPAWPVYERVTKEEFSDGSTKWTLCARQDYDQDIRDIRSLLIKGN
jgi:hypothetical protein